MVLTASGSVTFEPFAYDALILHVNCWCCFVFLLHLFVVSLHHSLSFHTASCFFAFRECGLCSVSYWEPNQCRGSVVYFQMIV